MSSSATRQPSPRNRLAVASPMPRAAPVTRATFCGEAAISVSVVGVVPVLLARNQTVCFPIRQSQRCERACCMQVIDPNSIPSETWRPGVETRMVVSARNGAAQLCIFAQWIAPGAGAPTHAHPVEEVLTVREGEAEMWIGEERTIVTSGQSLIVPAGRMHGFRNSGT